MTFDSARDLCLSLPRAEESMPFGPGALVYKVAGKMFALLMPDDVPARLNLKCDPERALELRDRHESILPGYHMSKKHWITVHCDGGLSSKFLSKLIDDSYRLVVSTLPKKDRLDL